MLDSASGRILYSHNAQQQMGMASTTKIITAITALENCDINSVATVSKNAYGVEGSSMYLGLGEKLTLEQLLYGLMLVSGNDAATAVAEHVSGSVEKFAELMNQTALKIGATNSSFTNPHGLSDEQHYTTAHDLAKITAYAMKNPKFREIVSTRTKNIPWKDHDYDRHLVNHNKLLSMYDGCIGVKTGFTKATGRCLVSAVERNGMTLICVTLRASDDWNDHMSLYDSTFKEYAPHKIKASGEVLTTAEVSNGSATQVELVTERDMIVPIQSNEEAQIKVKAVPFENLQAPIKKGDHLGYAIIELKGKKCGEYPLVANQSIELKKVFKNSASGTFSAQLKKVFFAWITCFY
ncbi:MAG: D-alanyl-D-alanine carboxypeptidase [Clostridia bacterium]|nr:D-alanyl-D-alanine carboxypeptidase [Clostridia bacterium]